MTKKPITYTHQRLMNLLFVSEEILAFFTNLVKCLLVVYISLITQPLPLKK